MNRKILIILLLSAILAVIIGCSKSPAPSQNPSPAPASVPAPGSSNPANQAVSAPKPPDESVLVQELIRKGQQVTEMSYEIAVIGAGITSNSLIWLKDNHMKIDTVVNGQRLISIVDRKKEEILTYVPDDKIATKITKEEYLGLDIISPMDYLSELSQKQYIIVGNEKINGLECKVILYTFGDNQVKVWIGLEHGLVVKVEDKMNHEVINMEYKKIKLGAGSVPDQVFSLPAGVEIIDLGNMMQGVPPGNP